MTSQITHMKWRQYCGDLESLGVDPYSPNISDEDERYEQIQAIIAKYRGVSLPLFPIPECWEGSHPPLAMTSLEDVSTWMHDEWSIIIATEMGSDDGVFHAQQRALKTVRNAHRILDVLGIKDRPLRQPPAESLAESKEQILHLAKWFSEKHKTGWKTPEKDVAAKATDRKRRTTISTDEANFKASQIIKQNPDIKSRDLAKQIGIAHGRVSKLDSWKHLMAERKAKRMPGKKWERQLTDEMLACKGKNNDPTEKVILDEAVWEYILKNATEVERKEHLMKSREDKDLLIETTLSQFNDELPPDFRVHE